MAEQPRLRCGSGRLLGRDVEGDLDLADGFAHLDDLRGARAWVAPDDATLRPAVSGVMVVGVAEQQARLAAMHDQPQVAADACRPEVAVLAAVDAVHLDAGVRRVHLEVEGRGLRRLLLVCSQPVEAGRERVGDPELHLSVSGVAPEVRLASLQTADYGRGFQIDGPLDARVSVPTTLAPLRRRS